MGFTTRIPIGIVKHSKQVADDMMKSEHKKRDDQNIISCFCI